MGILAEGHSKFREDIASIKTNTKQIWHCIMFLKWFFVFTFKIDTDYQG